MELLKKRVCSQCKTATSLPELKLMPSGQRDYALLCKPCTETAKSHAGQSAEARAERAINAESQLPSSPVSKELLICGHCSFRFRADLNEAGRSYNLRCQYCGRNDALFDMRGFQV